LHLLRAQSHIYSLLTHTLLFYCYSSFLFYLFSFFFFNDPATTEIYTLSLHDALPISGCCVAGGREWLRVGGVSRPPVQPRRRQRSEEHTSELQSRSDLVCRLLLEKKKKKKQKKI